MMQNGHNCDTELRNVSLKVTPARLGVLAALESSEKPVDVAFLITYLRNHKISADKVTVFRIINSLTAKGLVTPIDFQEGKLRYEYAAKGDHHHFMCESCGSITDIGDCHIDSLEKEMKKKKGLLINRHSLAFFGLCADCQA